MKKKTVTLTLDADVWLDFQNKVEDRQRSQTVNNLLRNFLQVSEPDGEEQEIKEELERISAERSGLMERQAALSAQLVALQQRRAAQEKAALEEFRQIGILNDRSNPLRDLD